MAHHSWKSDCKVYVGGLRDDANRYDLEDAFAKIGKVRIESMIRSVSDWIWIRPHAVFPNEELN